MAAYRATDRTVFGSILTYRAEYWTVNKKEITRFKSAKKKISLGGKFQTNKVKESVKIN
jgi:hypothetical protein